MSKIRKNDIRYNYRGRHIAHIKKVDRKAQKATSVLLSSKESNENRKNIPMYRTLPIGDTPYGYFMTRVRTYPISTYSTKKYKGVRMSLKDKRTSNKIYRDYLKRKKAEEKSRLAKKGLKKAK